MPKKLLVLFMLISAVGISGLPALELTLMTEEFPPYNYTRDKELLGFSSDIVKEIMKEVGLSLEIMVLPGARGYFYLRTRPGHMLFSLFRTPEREPLFKWIGPLATEEVYFFKKRGNPLTVRSMGEIPRDLVIATRHEGVILGAITQLGFKNISRTVKPEDIVKKVYHDRAALMASTPLEVAHILKELGLPGDTMEQTPVKLFQFDLYIACSKDIPDSEIKRWQEALDRIRASERYRRFYQDHMAR